MPFPFKLFIGLIVVSILAMSGSSITSMRADDPFTNHTLSSEEKAHIAKNLKPDLVEGIDSIATHFHERYGLSASVMVNYKGHKIFDKAYGTVSPHSEEALSVNDRYQLASVSKQFTAIATLMLVEEGKLNLTDTVKQHLPYFQYDRITVKQLLNHTAGLPNYMWAVEHHWDKESAPYNDEVLKLMDSLQLNLYFRPGTRFFYANTGYVALSQVVEEVSGQRYDSFLRERIFQPLGMDKAFVYSKAWEDREYPDHLKGYRTRGYRTFEVKNNPLDGTVGDKGIYATGEDLYKWDQALYKGTLTADSLQKQAFQVNTLPNGRTINYGFGFRLQQINNKPVIYHNGLWHGFRTSLKRYVEDSISLVVLNNMDSRAKGMLVNRLEQYLQDHTETGPVFRLVFRTLEGDSAGKASGAAVAEKLNDANAQKLRQTVRYLRLKRLMDPAKRLLRVYKTHQSREEAQARLAPIFD